MGETQFPQYSPATILTSLFCNKTNLFKCLSCVFFQIVMPYNNCE